MRNAGFGGGGDQGAIDLQESGVVLAPIEGALNAAESAFMLWRGGDRASEPEGANGGDLFRMEKIDPFESNGYGLFAEFL